MATHYTVRVVCKGKGTILGLSKVLPTLKDARRNASETAHDWRGGGVRVEIVRHTATVVR